MNRAFFIIVLLLISCKASHPYSSLKEKRTSLKTVKNYLNLSNDRYRVIKSKDSISYELWLSIEENIKPELMNRRLDSLFNQNYNERVLIAFLKLDRAFPDSPNTWEVNHSNRKGQSFNTLEEGIVVVKKFDSMLKKGIKMKIKSENVRQETIADSIQMITSFKAKKGIIGAWILEGDTDSKWIFTNSNCYWYYNNVIEDTFTYTIHDLSNIPSSTLTFCDYTVRNGNTDDYYLKLIDQENEEFCYEITGLNEENLSLSYLGQAKIMIFNKE